MFDPVLSELQTIGHLPVGVVALRLAGAMLLCGLIGFERETQDQAAGLRTHMLVGLAACVYCLIMLEMLERADNYPGAVRLDPIRVIEAVTSGVAFLAAGLIVFAQGQVRGLTTGASLWLGAAVGLACGLGLWVLALLTTVPALVIIRLLKLAETKLKSNKSQDYPPQND